MLLKHSGMYFLARIIPGAIGLLALATYTRLMTPDQYGLLALMIAVATLVNFAGFQWLVHGLGRFLPQTESKARDLLSSVVAGYIGSLAVCVVVGGIAILLWPGLKVRLAAVLAVLLGCALGWFEINLKLANAKLAPLTYGLLAAIKSLGAWTIGIALLLAGLGVEGVLIGVATACLLSTMILRRDWTGVAMSRRDPSLMARMGGYGMPLSVTLLLTVVLTVSDRFMLGWLAGIDSVGAYAAPYDLTQQALGTFSGVIHLAAFPLVVRALESEGVARACEQISQNALVLITVTLPAAVGFAILSPNIARVFLGSEFRAEADWLMTCLAASVLLAGFKSYYLDYTFQLSRKVGRQALVVFLTALLNIVLNLFWIPAYGPFGAALATLASIAFGMLLSWLFGRSAFPLPRIPLESYKPVLATIVMAACLWPTRQHQGHWSLVWQVLLGMAVYAAAWTALNPRRTRLHVSWVCNVMRG